MAAAIAVAKSESRTVAMSASGTVSAAGMAMPPSAADDDAVELVIDPELRDLIPPLEGEERVKLAASLLRDGCFDSLKVWRESLPQGGARHILLDGHNRYALCGELGVPFRVEEVPSVTSRHEAINWMIDLQLARRNLSLERKSYLRGRRYNEEKLAYGGDRKSSGNSYHLIEKTGEKLAKELGISEKTIRLDSIYAEAVDALTPDERRQVLSGMSPLTKKQLIEKHLITIGKRKLPDELKEFDYRKATRESIAFIDDQLATYNRDIKLELMCMILHYARHCAHVRLADVDHIWNTLKGETHD